MAAIVARKLPSPAECERFLRARPAFPRHRIATNRIYCGTIPRYSALSCWTPRDQPAPSSTPKGHHRRRPVSHRV
ncbi:hypothetical protein FAGKG844_360015 [Frankia sp. AgKG'84/4]